ncbi:MAG: hypothetical protein K9G71_03630 [Rhodobacteraceae bacterium]|nr:hypothetical protein [Paracoccaceae bacterium]MCF8513433.1 hypothetical protein [Paracoccaceae bacterium]MCF8517667.1 hypothetical protein [Paracoccaceae bacterium]
MKHWTKQTDVTGVTTSYLAVECISFDNDDQPQTQTRTPLLELLKSLAVTLPIARSFTVDRPGAI